MMIFPGPTASRERHPSLFTITAKTNTSSILLDPSVGRPEPVPPGWFTRTKRITRQVSYEDLEAAPFTEVSSVLASIGHEFVFGKQAVVEEEGDHGEWWNELTPRQDEDKPTPDFSPYKVI